MARRVKDDSGPPEWKATIDKLSDEYDTDFVLFSGGIDRRSASALFTALVQNRSRENVTLILATFGGAPDAAFLIAKYLHSLYPDGELTLFLVSYCKSAGTLVALAADSIVMADTAELGPLDVQVIKHDEVGERSSGLTPTQALTSLRGEAISMFGESFRKLREFGFPTRLGAQLAARMAVGLFRPLYEQIDPMRLGEIQRAMSVAADYGERLQTPNVKPDAVAKLLAKYPSHGFVIDMVEAKTLFNEVREPTSDEWEMAVKIVPLISEGQAADTKGEPARVVFLSTRKTESTAQPAPTGGDSNEHDDEPAGGSTAGAGQGEGGGATRENGTASSQPGCGISADSADPATNGKEEKLASS